MKIIRPISVTAANLSASNVPETAPASYNAGTTYAAAALVSVVSGTARDVYESLAGSNTGNAPASSPAWWKFLARTYADYSAGTTYAAGDVVLGTGNREYESVQAGNVGHALDDPAWWLDRGASNRFRMFDQSNGSVTARTGSIDVTIPVTGRIDSVGLLNLVAASVQVIVTTVADGEIYNETVNLVDSAGIDDWYEYFFEDIVRRGDLVLTNIPLNGNPTVRVIINEPDGTAQVGSLIIGQSRDLGTTIHPARIGIQDFSRKDQDQFGNYTIIQRAFARRTTFKVAVDEDAVDSFVTLLAAYRAEPVLWVGVDQYSATWVFGFYRDFAFDMANPNETYLNIELEGLT